MAENAANAIFGWSAPPMAEQFPTLTSEQADKFDALNRAVTLCYLHGLISDGLRDLAIKKCARQIGVDLAARPNPPVQP